MTGLLERGNMFLVITTTGTFLSHFNGEAFDIVQTWRTWDLQELAAEVASYVRSWPVPPRVLVVRSWGLGAGVLDILQAAEIVNQERRVQVVSDRISDRSTGHEAFQKLREACGLTRADLVKHGATVDINGNIRRP